MHWEISYMGGKKRRFESFIEMGRSRLAYGFVKASFEKEGYKLLSESYTNNKINLLYECNKRHVSSIKYNNWLSGYRCPYCAGKLVCEDNSIKALYPELAKELHPTDNGNLTADKISYGSRKKVWWICDVGHSWKATANNRVHGTRCPYCYGTIKHDIEFIKSVLAKEGYILLSEKYYNSKQKLKYICSNGHTHSIVWYNWKQGQRCGRCRYDKFVGSGNPNYGNGDKIRGKSNPSWKGGISFDPYGDNFTKKLKKVVLERDNYKCQNPDCWNKKGNAAILMPHHIDYNKKNCCLSNLITLCRSCNGRANFSRDYWIELYKLVLSKYFKKEVRILKRHK